jgi:hypothetical protein
MSREGNIPVEDNAERVSETRYDHRAFDPRYLHGECMSQCRSSLILPYIEQYPESLAVVDADGYLPLHILLLHGSSPIDVALMMIEKHPVALQHSSRRGYLPLHIECWQQCRSSIICKCIELYPESLAHADEDESCLPLHKLLYKENSTVDQALFMMEKYPAALQHRDRTGNLPVHIECQLKRRSPILSKFAELYPEAICDWAVISMLRSLNTNDFETSVHALSIIFAVYPVSLYNLYPYFRFNDIRMNPYYRRRILQLLPRHVFTPLHDEDYQDLNWQPRAAMITLLSQIKIQQQSRE